MNKKIISEYILSYAKQRGHIPSDIKRSRYRVGIAWSTPNFYYDVEVTEKEVEFVFSKNRKTMDFLTLMDVKYPHTDTNLTKALDRIFTGIETR